MARSAANQPMAARRLTGSFYWKAALVVTALYFVGGRMGLAVPFTRGNVSPIWPPAGIALAAILLCGYRIWPAVAVGAFLVNVLTPIPAYTAAAIAAGNTAGPLVGAWLLRRLAVRYPLMGHPRDVLGLIVLGAFGGTAISATVGTGVLSLTHVAPWSGVGAAWLMWWLGDAMGVLIVAPVALAIQGIRDVAAPRRRLELTALLLATISCSALVFHAPPALGSGSVIVAMTFPFLLMWSATRFELVGASLVTACIAAVGVWGTRYGLGPFVDGTSARNAALLQSFLTVIAVSGLSVAALVMERTRLIRQQAEREAVRAGQDRYREIARTPPTKGYGCSIRGCSPASSTGVWHRWSGYSAAEMMGKPAVSFVFPEDARQSQAQLERRRRGESEQFETRYRRKDGSELWATVSTTGSFDTDGRFTGVLAMVSDITEQRRREVERRASRRETLLMTRAVEQTADSVVVTDKHGVIEYVNPAFEATTGYVREEAVGRTMAILKSGQHDPDFYKGLWNELLQGRTFRGTLVNRKKVGELYWAEQTISPIRDDEGEITQFVSVLKDVTELRRKHEQEVQLRLAREVQQRFYAAPMAFPGLDLAAASVPSERNRR